MMRTIQIATISIFCLLLIPAPLLADDYSNKLFPVGSPLAGSIDVVDILGEDPDTRLAAITLQGIINRGPEAKVYYIAEKNCNDLFWLELTQKEKQIDSYRKITLDILSEKYKDCYEKVIIYDAELINTINIATMMASVENGIVIAKKDLKRFGRGKEVVDLTGRWQSNVQAYNWAYENLLDKMSSKVLACYHPDSIPHNLRDYLTAHKIFTFWITSKEKQDGIKSDFEKEKNFAAKLFQKFAPGTPVVGFWYSGKDPGINEYTGVGFAGEYGMITIPGDWNTNLSFHSGTKVDWAKVIAQYRKTRSVKEVKIKKDKIYLCFAITESGDSPMYWQAAEYEVWSDKDTGNIPINWSLGPATMELMPLIMKWYYQQIPTEDYFFIGLSGAGYTHPYRNLFGKTVEPESAWREYLDLTRHYMEVFGVDYLGLYTDAWVPFDRKENDLTTLRFINNIPSLKALIMGMGRDDGLKAEDANYYLGKQNILVSHVMTRWDSANIGRNAKNNQWLAEEIRKNSPGSKPGFMMVHPISWSYYASDLVEVMNLLGDDYQVVSLPTFIEMVRE